MRLTLAFAPGLPDSGCRSHPSSDSEVRVKQMMPGERSAHLRGRCGQDVRNDPPATIECLSVSRLALAEQVCAGLNPAFHTSDRPTRMRVSKAWSDSFRAKGVGFA